MLKMAEYIWIDGKKPTQTLRSKARVINKKFHSVGEFPEWGFDGSSTDQSEGDDSDLVLKPVRHCPDPVRGEGNYLVLCEVMTTDENPKPHTSNTRAKLRATLDSGAADLKAWFGFEQEYTLYGEHGRPLGWPERKRDYPAPQGRFYCGVGADEVFGRRLVEEHAEACIEAGLLLYGVNAEVMPGQWEFQIGPRDFELLTNEYDPLVIADHLWLARYLLYRIGEKYGISATLDPKPEEGDWNGAGCHTNFSTEAMRNGNTGAGFIEKLQPAFERNHDAHIEVYGHGNDNRLTGDHETCSITKFRWGDRDRGASIRVPDSVAKKGYGYLEDRRPAANMDPYLVSDRILTTILEAVQE